MNRLKTAFAVAVAVLVTITGCSGGGWNEETKQDYVDVTDDMATTLTIASMDTAGWQTHCLKLAGLASDGLDLPDGPSEEFDKAWDAAMEAYSAAADGSITQCTAAMNVATGYINEATALLDEETS